MPCPISISDRNSKMGRIPSVSLPPVLSCPPGVPCGEDCLACHRRYKTRPVKAALARNWEVCQTDRQLYFNALEGFLAFKGPEFFRFHVAGDIPDQAYLRRMYRLARRFFKTKFLVFTKNHGLNFGSRPSNMAVLLSMWPEWGDTRKRMPRAWLNVPEETRMPSDVMHCSGACDSCGLCWELPSIGRDVALKKR